MKVIDLFAGCGGLSIGFIQSGFDIIRAVEYDRMIANTYTLNYPNIDVVVDDIKEIDNADVFKFADAEIMIGGPPCQGFSMAGARIRHGFIDDQRNYLFKHYFNIVKAVKPKFFIMENVKGMQTMQNGEIFNEIKDMFSNSDLLDGQPYYVCSKIIKTVDFGIPQKRERLIIFGSSKQIANIDELWQNTINDIKQEQPTFFNAVTVKDAIGNLGKATVNGRIKNPVAETEYERYLACDRETLENHTKTNHSLVAINRMKQVNNGENYTVLNEQINSIHSGSYGRLCWDEQAPTITTRFDTPTGGRFIHPIENRTITPREAARIQSFPDKFVFYGNKTSICKQIGNAVPPKLSYFLAKYVKKIIHEKYN